jgi:5-methylcytosine-specific restriction endonuclease McrA
MRRSEGLLLECLLCRKMLARGRFYRKGKGWRSYCKECEKPGKSARNALRRERAKGRGSYTAKEVRQLLAMQNYLCKLCNRHLGITGYHVDHVVALAKGGMNVVRNLQVLCPACNLAKGAR